MVLFDCCGYGIWRPMEGNTTIFQNLLFFSIHFSKSLLWTHTDPIIFQTFLIRADFQMYLDHFNFLEIFTTFYKLYTVHNNRKETSLMMFSFQDYILVRLPKKRKKKVSSVFALVTDSVEILNVFNLDI